MTMQVGKLYRNRNNNSLYLYILETGRGIIKAIKIYDVKSDHYPNEVQEYREEYIVPFYDLVE